MPANFLHGVETIELPSGTRPIRAVKSAIVGIVGTAPLWAVAAGDQRVNTPVLVTSERDAAKYFGPETSGYTIPAALRAVFAQGRGLALVVNVFDPAVHKTAHAAAVFPLNADGVVQLPHKGVRAVVVKNADATTTHLLGTDYTLDAAAGTITRKAGGAIAAGASLSIAYDSPNPGAITATEVNGLAGPPRTGAQAFLDCPSTFGFGPRLLIAPGFSGQVSVRNALTTLAERLRAIVFADVPLGAAPATVLEGRGADGDIDLNTSSPRVVLFYPHVKVPDPAGGADPVLEPLSAHAAGAVAARDQTVGFHWSLSNAPLTGILGAERPLTASISDPNSEANLLNEAGVVTLFNNYGSGWRLWGNRSAAYPASTAAETFVSIRRVADVLHDSIEAAMLQYLDRPISSALVDEITGTVNAFIRVLQARGAIVDGRCTFDPSKNPAEEMAAGHLTFDLSFMPPPPAERISFESFIDTGVLTQITAA